MFFAIMSDKASEVFVKPREGLKVVNPNAPQRFVSEKGETLQLTTGVRRFLKAKDLVEVKKEAKPAKSKKPKPGETVEE